MPPLLPNAVSARFQKRITDLLRDFDELILAVHQKHRQASLEAMIAEQTVMSTAVLWETFINDLIIAYVVQEPRSCLADSQNRLRQSVNDKFGGISRWVTVDLPVKINQAQAERLLDPKGWNIGATSAQALSELANRHLHGVHAKRFSLGADDRDFVDYLVSLRNYLSHRSSASRVQFGRRVQALAAGGPNERLVGATRHISSYLRERLAAGGTRVNIVGRRTVEIAARLG
jgi:hypothetical protein